MVDLYIRNPFVINSYRLYPRMTKSKSLRYRYHPSMGRRGALPPSKFRKYLLFRHLRAGLLTSSRSALLYNSLSLNNLQIVLGNHSNHCFCCKSLQINALVCLRIMTYYPLFGSDTEGHCRRSPLAHPKLPLFSTSYGVFALFSCFSVRFSNFFGVLVLPGPTHMES